MARPIKSGLDYFPLDCVLDDKIKLIEAEFGLKGFSVIIKLYQKIYAEQGYYCKLTEEVALLFAREIGLGGDVVSEIIKSAIRRGIFDKEMYERFSILTSGGIQKRYFEAAARRKAVFVNPEYLLISRTLLPQNVCTDTVDVDINPNFADTNPQRKVKKSKEKERKEKESRALKTENKRFPLSRYGKYNNVLLTECEFDDLEFDYTDTFKSKIERLSYYLEVTGKEYKNHYATLIEWLEADKADDIAQLNKRKNKTFDIADLEKFNYENIF